MFKLICYETLSVGSNEEKLGLLWFQHDSFESTKRLLKYCLDQIRLDVFVYWFCIAVFFCGYCVFCHENLLLSAKKTADQLNISRVKYNKIEGNMAKILSLVLIE